MLMLLTLRGTPFLYYGEEIGMTDGPIPPERIVDVDGRDPERTPMQWESGPGAGFTTGAPWLPIPPDAETVNVAAQRRDPASMLSFTRELLALRRRSAALRSGSYRTLGDRSRSVFAYVREADGERLLVALNLGRGTSEVTGAAALGTHGTLEISTDPSRARARVDLSRLRLGVDEGMIVRLG
jgi:alpha-glucosidase